MTTNMYPKATFPTVLTWCGITGPLALWAAVGLQTKAWVGDMVEWPHRESQHAATDAELIEAKLTTGDDGEKALVWLIAERRRQAEAGAALEASTRLAAAQKKAGDDAIHAARIHRQAEELRCLAAGVNPRSIDNRLS